ncbi:hypothetical protein K502DRAFT_287777 [Neoconidiobolus thromboides FSU 785]|nr:hypothetical protein K502DRAFT_287777 [Neoconidiobolus thromboides FSU 785]
MISRALLLVLFPVAIVSIWCSVPLQVVEVDPGDSDNPHDAYQMKFWFFLLFYYGFYNLTALLMVSQYFNLYSFHWWPKSIGGLWSTFFFWLFSMFLGSLIYYFNFFYKSVYTWVLLTFITLMLPLFSAFLIIRNEKRNVYRHSLTDAQKIFLLIQDNRIPYSYKRFLWFCFTLIINFSALILGETYALKFTSTEDKSWLDGIIYVYTWVVTVFILDFICDYIVETRIRSWALSHVYRLYFALIYFVFYRNLFIKLRSAEQFYTVQICSSLWVIFNYPLRMSKFVYNITKWFGSKRKYEDYCKNVGRSFFIRNLAENASMVGFLCWVNILHFGQNSRVYPHFGKFDPDITNPGNNNFYPLRITASLGVWVCELLSAFITRLIFKKVYDHSITREAVQDFYRYPEVIRAMILVTIHVLQDMLLALINLQTLT